MVAVAIAPGVVVVVDHVVVVGEGVGVPAAVVNSSQWVILQP